ncbi:mercury transporter [Streptomyces sp. NPDC054841]
MSGPRERSRPGGLLGGLGAGLLMVLCCAGPLLLGGGALAAVGGFLSNPWLITVGAMVVVMAVAYVLRCRARRRRRRGTGPDDCYP